MDKKNSAKVNRDICKYFGDHTEFFLTYEHIERLKTDNLLMRALARPKKKKNIYTSKKRSDVRRHCRLFEKIFLARVVPRKQCADTTEAHWVKYLRMFDGFSIIGNNRISISGNVVTFPPFFEMLPIKLICDDTLADGIDTYLKFPGTKVVVPEGLDVIWRNFLFPLSLKVLCIAGKIESDLPALPEGLEILFLFRFNQRLPNLPNSLIKLYLSQYRGTLPSRLPPRLQELDLNQYAGTTLPILPDTLRRLWISSYHGPLPDPLPAALTDLGLSRYRPKSSTDIF